MRKSQQYWYVLKVLLGICLFHLDTRILDAFRSDVNRGWGMPRTWRTVISEGSQLYSSTRIDTSSRVTQQQRHNKVNRKPQREQSVEEYNIRGAIMRKEWEEAKVLISSLNTTVFGSGRTVVYIIVETCRRNRAKLSILPLLNSIPSHLVDQCSDGDITPFLIDCAKTGMNEAQPVIEYYNTNNIPLSAKSYSIILNGYGRQKNERMVDLVLHSFSNMSPTSHMNHINPDVVSRPVISRPVWSICIVYLYHICDQTTCA